MAQSSIIGVGGENLIDHVTRDGTVSTLAGGSPFNVAMALGRQSANVHYLTPISNDDWGTLLADTLTASHVVLSGGRVDAPTTIARVTVTDGIPSYTFERDGTAERQVTATSLQDVIPDGLAALHTGSMAVTEGADADAWEATCDSAFTSGQLVSLDPNVRLSVITDPDQYRARIFRMMGKTNLLKLSDEDLEGLCPAQSLADALRVVRDKASAPLLVMTKGPDGATALIGDAQVDIPAPPVPGLVDTVGAGDTFMATLLAGLDRIDALSPDALSKLSRDDVEALLRRAGMAAAINCSRAGCNPPSLDELEAALRAAG
ncbi:carbohydrate kinase [Marivita sp. S6314]|uniref:carbohydrate kinase family protein n=1 Tax=Marivita sp. S6314 TaxID=2926406 RepID=UPI001FF4A027|nr:carbohydrate kinase [Marivita sp. S6314]MCK0149803.1 carbohydrate kinase [Marivita sp. S6314]